MVKNIILLFLILIGFNIAFYYCVDIDTVTISKMYYYDSIKINAIKSLTKTLIKVTFFIGLWVYIRDKISIF